MHLDRCLLPSISSTLYARVFGTNFLPKQNVTRHVTREKLPNRRLYEKFVRKMLMKSAPALRGALAFQAVWELAPLPRAGLVADLIQLMKVQ